MSDEVKKPDASTASPKTEAATGTGGVIFGITSETKDSNNVPLPLPRKLEKPHPSFPTGWQFPTAQMVNVICNPEYEKKDGTTMLVLLFVFKDKKGRGYTHFEFAPDPTDAKFETKYDGLNVRLKHFHVQAFGPWSEGQSLGKGATNFVEYFNLIADDFNSRKTEDGKKIYAQGEYYIKLPYYKANRSFPLSPNFLERVNLKDPVCRTLEVNVAYDKLEPVKTDAPNIPGMGASGEAPTDLPNFDNGYA